MQHSQTYRTDPSQLRRLAGTVFMALAIMLTVWLVVTFLAKHWPATVPVLKVPPTVIFAPASDAVTPCTSISDDCADVTPQPATAGPHAPQTAAVSTLPLLRTGARFAAGTDSACFYAVKYGVDCASVKNSTRQMEDSQ